MLCIISPDNYFYIMVILMDKKRKVNKIKCPKCNGKGKYWLKNGCEIICKECWGKGKIEEKCSPKYYFLFFCFLWALLHH